MRTVRSTLAMGSGRRTTARTTLKIAVVEDRGRGAGAEGEREERDGGEAGCSADDPKRVAGIFAELVDQSLNVIPESDHSAAGAQQCFGTASRAEAKPVGSGCRETG